MRKLLDVVKEDMETVGVTVEEVMMRWRKTICCDNPRKEQPKKKKIAISYGACAPHLGNHCYRIKGQFCKLWTEKRENRRWKR